MDTPVCSKSYEVARLAAGGVLVAVDAVVAGQVRNAFCTARPGGHHAMPGRGMGFCLFNHVAIAARYAQRQHGLERILIVDWDVHHGNGTQAIFYDDPTVLFFDIHQNHFYPRTGAMAERGVGRGLGFTVNVPLEAGLGDDLYRLAIRDKLLPAAREFRPDLLLVSAGFDAYKHDVLGRMKVTPRGFAELTRMLKAVAREQCRDRLVAVLEGGYNLEGLADCVEAHIRTLAESGE
jgi:acetoin utilization deacetylase AcuC-like enzyme